MMVQDVALLPFYNETWHFILEWFNDKDTVLLKTSGSTGAPHTIEVKKQYMRNSAQMTVDFLNLKEKDTALLCLSPSYIAGKMMIVRALECGLDLLFAVPSGNPLKAITETIHFAAMVPLQVENVLSDNPSDLHKIEQLILGGAPLNPVLEERLFDFPNVIWQTYGMTETVSHIAMRMVNGKAVSNAYSPMSGVCLSLDDRGCLQIVAPRLAEAKIVTNDLVNLHDDGRFEFLGRYDHVINSGGLKISPEVVERKIDFLFSARFFISSLPDVRLGQKVILLIEGHEKDYDVLSLMSQMKSVLSSYECPKDIYFLPVFDETASGKVKRTFSIL